MQYDAYACESALARPSGGQWDVRGMGCAAQMAVTRAGGGVTGERAVTVVVLLQVRWHVRVDAVRGWKRLSSGCSFVELWTLVDM